MTKLDIAISSIRDSIEINDDELDSFKKIVENAPLLIDFQINSFLKHKKNYKTPQEKMQYIKEFIPVLLEINNEIIRSEYIKMVASPPSICRQQIRTEAQRIGIRRGFHSLFQTESRRQYLPKSLHR